MSLDVAAYYFPGFHVDPQVEQWHGRGWTEWELLKCARPRYDGHYQPRVPQWGYFDEADPSWGAQQAAAARKSGITAFLFDWYWYGGPFLNRALDEGFLKADRAGLKFALHWCNHDWKNVQPRLAFGEPAGHFSGACPREQFDSLVDHVIDKYLGHPDYLWVAGAPYFSIYEVGSFIDGLGSSLEAARALQHLRQAAKSAGLPGVHINVVLSDLELFPERRAINRAELISELGADSVGSYVWVHHYPPGQHGFPRGSYTQAALANVESWQSWRREFAVPYHPNVTVGWDSSPRSCQSDTFEEREYPWLAVLEGNTPAAYESYLRQARRFVEEDEAERSSLITINAWNEWTESSYLLPDERHGMSYLDATRRVFDDLVPLVS